MTNRVGSGKNLMAGGDVILNPITDEMIDGAPSDVEEPDEEGINKQEQEDLLKFIKETGAHDSSDLPRIDIPESEEEPDQDLLHETIAQDKQTENLAKDDAVINEDPVESNPQPEDDKGKAESEPKTESKARARAKRQERIDLGRDLMPEAYTAQEKKMFTLIENWDDVRIAAKTKRLVRGDVTQVNDDDHMITVRFDNIRGIIPYQASGIEDRGGSLVWLVGRPICFVIESFDEKSEGGFFVANRAKGLEALATEVKKVIKVGSIRQAVVSKIEPWGAWVEMGGVYGRLARRDMLHSFVTNITDVIQTGDLIDVKVTKISDTGRIQVSLKDALPDPWLKVPHNYKVGSIVLGKITGYISDLIFIEVEPGVNTVAPFPRFPINVGQRVAAKLRWIDVENKRMSSSIWKTV